MFKNHNYLSAYDNAVIALKSSADNPELQHQAVLALARAGALDFAWAEYERYGLGRITEYGDKTILEDIMSLKGRLLKDMALRAKSQNCGDICADFSRRSATAYERAFVATQGYYSGINVATMSLLGGRKERTIRAKTEAVLDILPNTKAMTQEETYYIEATRAEALLLMGHKNQAGDHFQNTVMHDPLNYTAHATTLKQFRNILDVRGEDAAWLEPFSPPTAVYFAGHIFTNDNKGKAYLAEQVQADLRAEICDQIQRHDIGFGYGALAAGSDILIAETLLEQGAELHVILPAPVDQFIETSVTPFGTDWDARFDACLMRANSVTICKNTGSQWPDKTSTTYASQTAMGKTVMRANTLYSRAAQLLVWDEDTANSATTTDALCWRESGHKQIIIPYPAPRTSISNLPERDPQALIAMIYIDMQSLTENDFEKAVKMAKNCAHSPTPTTFTKIDTGILVGYERAGNAAQCAQNILANVSEQFPDKNFHISGHYGPIYDPEDQSEDLIQTAQNIGKTILPSEIYVSEPFAAALAVFNGTNYVAEYVGTRSLRPTSTEIRLFHLEKKSLQ
ncbi:MAG: TRAFs-binding domain-containing protein [Robiginitomaculum sp.]|nr:TRAFs-binding domain-containing protein [Robiginitomaculum sp.]